MLLAKNDIEEVRLELLSKGIKPELGVARRNGALGAMKNLAQMKFNKKTAWTY